MTAIADALMEAFSFQDVASHATLGHDGSPKALNLTGSFLFNQTLKMVPFHNII